jgi:hypothetical protein
MPSSKQTFTPKYEIANYVWESFNLAYLLGVLQDGDAESPLSMSAFWSTIGIFLTIGSTHRVES